MIEVFKTDVSRMDDVVLIKSMLLQSLAIENISFDLEDCDKVLRLEANAILPQDIIDTLQELGFTCSLLT